MSRETDFSSPKRLFDVFQYDLHRLYVSSVSPLIPTQDDAADTAIIINDPRSGVSTHANWIYVRSLINIQFYSILTSSLDIPRLGPSRAAIYLY
jgi:hypothetical protein